MTRVTYEAGGSRNRSKTPLAEARARRGMKAAVLAQLTGISVDTISRYERPQDRPGAVKGPNLRILTNLALALNCSLEEVCEPEWLSWTTFSQRTSKPPSWARRSLLEGRD